ncbi:TRAP transporter substrate-binding protein [Oceanobacillus jeddahense]|uniref:TRAP transporter substrate-binding protein n=1 Tax=Oceanobacillus jeddahense TaxID=1462527 RepID=A0ABY5JZG2_9BACI|nr:TRAP transporter substrate-binding protein [Oceanobacillus jeddahense]UUI05164.1 TRAP transporter substrate-binding protein [Oceanobacillus jeddahense]
MKIVRNLTVFVIAALAIGITFAFFTTSNALTDDTITIRFGHDAAETNERHIAVLHFKELVEEKSGGQMEVLVYPNNQLGSESEMVESVALNDLQMVAASAYSQYNPQISVLELPYLFEDHQQAWDAMDGEVGELAAEPLLEDNLRIIAYFENGFRHITANKPIEDPSDLRGVKIRTPEFPVSLRTFTAFGGNPTPMSFGEVYMGLQQGTIDAQENPVANTYANKLNEVQDYLILTGHQYSPLPVAIGEEFWQSLTSKEQKIVEESALETAQFHRDLLQKNEAEMIEDLKDQGMTVIEDPDVEAFKEAGEPVYEQFRNNYGSELLDQILEATE